MLKKLGLFFAWFTLTPALLITSTLLFSNKAQVPKLTYSTQHIDTLQEPKIALSQNNLEGEVLGEKIVDLRPILVENFLKRTPLKTYSEYIVQMADKYEIDYRWVPAIAMKETGGGLTAPDGSFNAWGFENGRTRFISWEQSIDNVTKTLKQRYIDKGLTTPEEIMPIYAPPAVENGGGWARDINDYFAKMEKL